jgi:hypothetical protein
MMRVDIEVTRHTADGQGDHDDDSEEPIHGPIPFLTGMTELPVKYWPQTSARQVRGQRGSGLDKPIRGNVILAGNGM